MIRVARLWEVLLARKESEFRSAIYACRADLSIQQNSYLLSAVIVDSVGGFQELKQ